MRFPIVAFVALAAFFLSFPGLRVFSAGQDDLVAAFDGAVFNLEFGQRSVDFVRKWQAPLKIAVYGDRGGKQAKRLREKAEFLAGLINRPVVILPRGNGKQNVKLYFGDEDARFAAALGYVKPDDPFLDRVETEACVGKSNAREFTLESGFALVGEEGDNACLLKALANVAGLAYLAEPFSEVDAQLLRALYDARLSSGLIRAEALKTLPAIFAAP